MKFKDFKKLIEQNRGKFLTHDMIDEYHIFLVKWQHVNICEVGLSYKDMPFMFPGQQEENSGQVPRDFMQIAKSLLSHLIDWVDLYDDELIRISSHNIKKISFYHKIINHYLGNNLYTSNIIKDPMLNYFIISKTPINKVNNFHFNESIINSLDTYKETNANISSFIESSTITPDLISSISNFNKTLSNLFKLSEDAMGGVSAPFATLNNTPGMGNAIPAGPATNWIGSGDSWGNVLNDKPYTQSSKKKKKKKSLTEADNINPYDKLGNKLAKTLKVNTPFKKTKSKNNQNSMKQKHLREYEEIHNEYDFDEKPYVKNIEGKLSPDEFIKKGKGAPLKVTREKLQSLLLMLSDMDKHIIRAQKEGKPQVITNMDEWLEHHGFDSHDALTTTLYKLKFRKVISNKVRSNANTRFHTAGVWEQIPYPKGISDNYQLLLYAIMKNSRQNWGQSFDNTKFNLKNALQDNSRLLLLFYIILEIGANTKGVPFLNKYGHKLNIARSYFDLEDIDISKI